jgi:hypothetical protein
MPIQRRMVLGLTLLSVTALTAQAHDQDDRGPGAAPQRSAPAPSRQPMAINMGRPSSGGHNSNFPSQRPAGNGQAARPSWGQGYRQAPPTGRQPQARAQAQAGTMGRPWQASPGQLKQYSDSGLNASSVVHHHPYSPGYVRQKLQKLGVTQEPSYITDRAEIVHTDREHSRVPMPAQGPDHLALKATLAAPRGADGLRLRQHMDLVSRPEWHERLGGFERDEDRPGRYYWHHDDGFDYCHYQDRYGYHWYGWYLGDRCFWTRYYSGRWWWYDTDFDRWSFYNDGFWWWQDPYHVGDLYCYNEGAYIPVNSLEDQIVVTQPSTVAVTQFASPDGTRMVKLVDVSEDAFLYDTAVPPSFNPIYLASGVQRVEFSNTNNGRPLEIVLKLNDGSFDLFDGQGQPYNPGAAEGPVSGDQGGDAVPAGYQGQVN